MTQEFRQTSLSRRDFLSSFAGGLGACAALALLQRETHARGARPALQLRTARARRCIFFFMAGGVSQIDLFDPKPKLRELHGQAAPASYFGGERFAFVQSETASLLASPFRFVRSGQCGMELSELMPELARQADRLCLLRSLHSEPFNHHPAQTMLHTGFARLGRPAMGAWLTYGLGEAAAELPAYVVLEAEPNLRAGPDLYSSGFLPAKHTGVRFNLSAQEYVHGANRPRGLTAAADRATLELLARLNRTGAPASGSAQVEERIANYEQAFRLQAALPTLTDLSGETDATLHNYGAERPEGAGRFARACLLARRMLERGVRFVHVLHADWDHHTDLEDGLRRNCLSVDQPIAALLNDLAQRGLLDDTLVVWCSEFGRTSLGENRQGRPGITGRDHQPGAFSAWLAGGGVRAGSVYGATDELGWRIAENPVSVHDFQATLLHLFGFDHEQLTFAFEGRRYRLTDVSGRVVPELLA